MELPVKIKKSSKSNELFYSKKCFVLRPIHSKRCFRSRLEILYFTKLVSKSNSSHPPLLITNLFQTFIFCAFHFIALENNSKKAGNQTYIRDKSFTSLP